MASLRISQRYCGNNGFINYIDRITRPRILCCQQNQRCFGITVKNSGVTCSDRAITESNRQYERYYDCRRQFSIPVDVRRDEGANDSTRSTSNDYEANAVDTANENNLSTLGEQLSSSYDGVDSNSAVKIPLSSWIYIDNIGVHSSLENMISAINTALGNEQNTMGILDLDAVWSTDLPLPFLEPIVMTSSQSMLDDMNDEITSNGIGFVHKALVILSSFGRPNGWYIKLHNRSMVYSLLVHVKNNSTQGTLNCAWKQVKIHEYKGPINPITNAPESTSRCIVPLASITDRTVRVENCPRDVTGPILFSFFSRYDLAPPPPASQQIIQSTPFGDRNQEHQQQQQQRQNTNEIRRQSTMTQQATITDDICGGVVQKWIGTTPDGKQSSTPTYLVHFADSSWARAAIREKQSSYLRIDAKHQLRLVQYPKQLL